MCAEGVSPSWPSAALPASGAGDTSPTDNTFAGRLGDCQRLSEFTNSARTYDRASRRKGAADSVHGETPRRFQRADDRNKMLAYLLELRAWWQHRTVYPFAVFMTSVWILWFLRIVLARRYKPWRAP